MVKGIYYVGNVKPFVTATAVAAILCYLCCVVIIMFCSSSFIGNFLAVAALWYKHCSGNNEIK